MFPCLNKLVFFYLYDLWIFCLKNLNSVPFVVLIPDSSCLKWNIWNLHFWNISIKTIAWFEQHLLGSYSFILSQFCKSWYMVSIHYVQMRHNCDLCHWKLRKYLKAFYCLFGQLKIVLLKLLGKSCQWHQRPDLKQCMVVPLCGVLVLY